jgi:hypothetical protein
MTLLLLCRSRRCRRSAPIPTIISHTACAGHAASRLNRRIIASADLSVDGGGTDTGFLYLLNNQSGTGSPSLPLTTCVKGACGNARSPWQTRSPQPVRMQAHSIRAVPPLPAGPPRARILLPGPGLGALLRRLHDRLAGIQAGILPCNGRGVPVVHRRIRRHLWPSNSTEVSLDLLIGGLISANPSPSFWSTSSSGAASSVVESYLGEFLPAPIAFTFSHQERPCPQAGTLRYPSSAICSCCMSSFSFGTPSGSLLRRQQMLN